MIVHNVSQCRGEAAMLNAAIADFDREGHRLRYAKFLEAQGHTERAASVRATIEAFHSLDAGKLESLDGDEDWLGMLGVNLLRAFITGTAEVPQRDVAVFRDLVFSNLLPCLSLEYAPMEGEPAVGTSRLWGLPDLPADQKWPKIAEASNWFDSKGYLPPDNHCAFIAQVSFTDFQETVFGQALPTNAGFSVHAISEVNELGITETLIRPWDASEKLTRREAPTDIIEDKLGGGSNRPSPPQVISVKERLSLPDATDGVFSALIPMCGWKETYHDIYYGLMENCGGGTLGFGGYLRGTSGSDPSPDTCARRFAVLRTTPDAGIAHFSIPDGDVEAGNLSRVQYVWNDWDS